MATHLAHELGSMIEDRSFPNGEMVDSAPVLLLLDRRFDLITPMLTQWTYHAMLHESFGIHNGRVRMDKAHGERYVEYDLCPQQDEFLRDNIDCNFGELGGNVLSLVKEFQDITQQHQLNLETLPKMKRLIEDYPHYRRMSSYVSKHVDILDHISHQIDSLKLMRFSELQQDIATSKSTTISLLSRVTSFLKDDEVNYRQKLRIAIIYALKHRRCRKFDLLGFIDLLRSSGLLSEDIKVNFWSDILNLLVAEFHTLVFNSRLQG